MDVSILTQAGAVGIAAGLVWVVWKLGERSARTHDRTLDVLDRNARAITKLEGTIERNTQLTSEMLTAVRELARWAENCNHRYESDV